MLTTSEHINEIAAALAKAQGSMDNASKDRSNPAFKSKYADLASVRDAVIGPLTAAGIAVIQAPSTTAEGVVVETRFVHSSGQWLSCSVGATPRAYDPQSVGSAITYLRRYGLMALASIAPEDDDGNAASGAPMQRTEPVKRWEERPPAPKRWSDNERKAFCAELDKLGVKYEAVGAWCESVGKPRPSEMEPAQRSAVLSALLGPARGKFDAFVATPTPKDSK
jgi:hypothetical protein